MENKEYIQTLFQKYLEGKCSRDEIAQLMAWFGPDSSPQFLKFLIKEELQNDSTPDPEMMGKARAYSNHVGERLQRKIGRQKNIAPRGLLKKIPAKWLSAAAAFLLLAVAGLTWMYTGKSFESSSEVVLHNRYGEDALPGTSRATLTLASGATIDLDSAVTGTLATLDGITITKQEGLISYEIHDPGLTAAKPAFNTITTPRGGQYRLVLPDGSKVWLNAASSLRYPAHFDNKERIVELSGEAYFEISHEQNRPFIVKSKGQLVQVLGTEFNINAYDNESTVNTTLVNGSVRIRRVRTGTTKVLKPGQQALLSPGSIRVAAVNTTEYTAWKNGDFLFNETDLHQILRQLERWYNIEVNYNNIPHRKLSAAISRDKELSGVLYMIESATGLVFTLEERRLSLSQ